MARTYFRFVPTGQEYEMTDRFMLPELVWIQKHIGLDLNEMGAGTQTMMGMFLQVRRTDPQRWNVKAFEGLSTEDFDMFEREDPEDVPAEDQEETPDPTEGSAPADPGPAAESTS